MRTDTSLRRSIYITLLSLLFMLAGADFGYAQYFNFGKNRVQYNQHDWKFIQSEHFDVYYYGSLNYELAAFSVRSLEAAYKQLSEDFDHEIASRINVIVYDSHNDFSQTNVVPLPVDAEGIGGVTDAWKNRITLPFMGDYANYRRTLHHELVHAMMNDMFYGGSVQSILQNNIQLEFPLWFSEGISEYTALGWDTETDMFIRDAVINNYLAPIPRLRGYYAYRGGQAVWNYIVEEYGREKISEIFHNIQSSRSVEIGIKQSLGLSIKELSKRWQQAMKKRYFPEVAKREDLDNFADHITDRDKGGSYNTSPAISPQGDKIALITNARGYFDVVVISAITGKKIKTLIKGEDNVNFESLNILNPNLTWSPDGEKIALSTKSKGHDQLAIVDYDTKKVQKFSFPKLDAIASAAWSPDGEKIAFSGNIGPYQDIFVYNLETKEFISVTNDIFTDKEPAWSGDSESVFFVSDRGDKVALNRYKEDYNQLLNEDLYQTDIYQVKIGSKRATRLTKTPRANEYQPSATQSGELVLISDKNGIPNIYRFNLLDRTMEPLTNLQSGVMQISISADGSRIAANALNEGYLDVYMIKAPFTRTKEKDLESNHWAERRANESEYERVPATKYALQMYGDEKKLKKMDVVDFAVDQQDADKIVAGGTPDTAGTDDQKDSELAKADTSLAGAPSEKGESADTTEKKSDKINYRNYVFADTPENDSLIQESKQEEFKAEEHITEEGHYIPQQYRLKFSPDITYTSGNLSTQYGAFGMTQLVYSDLLGNHSIVFGSNLVFDLRNSDYMLQYGYMKQRTNYFVNFFHTSTRYQTVYGELLRFRTYGGGLSMQYPINKFERIDIGGNVIAITKDFSVLGLDRTDNESSTFFYPQVTYTNDHTLPGFITPQKGTRYSLSLTSSPPITKDVVQFVSALGDWRHYIDLGSRYSLAFRASGAASFGRDAQTYFMGGMMGWINQRWARNSIPTDRLEDLFFTLPALPMRGHSYNTLFGSRFGLINAEFRFPLFAAVLPGPIPVLPLYNIQGVAFVDAGTAWGMDINYTITTGGRTTGNEYTYYTNEENLDLQVSQLKTKYLDMSNPSQGIPLYDDPRDAPPEARGNLEPRQIREGDILIGAGFGLRTILLGLPFRWDVGWPYTADGFRKDPIHYFTIGIDF